MKSKFKIVSIISILIISYFITHTQTMITYALENKEDNLDLLILNKERQEEIEIELQELEALISDASNVNNDTLPSDVDVVSVSFIQGESIENSTTYIEKLEEDRKVLEEELQSNMIEGVKIEKVLEEEAKQYLADNNLDYFKGDWPLDSEYTRISSDYGNRVHPISYTSDFHRGIDIPAPQNSDVKASDDGIVIFSGVINGYGNIVKIEHFDGKITAYAHNTSNVVSEGDIVKRGDTIAKVGSTGNSTGNHVHFETIINGEYIHPLEVVDIPNK